MATRCFAPLLVIIACAALLAGCSSGGASANGQSAVLTNTPLAKLFPANADWQKADNEAGFEADPPKVQKLSKSYLAKVDAETKQGNATAVDVGAACAKVINHFPSVKSWVEEGSQEVATGGEDESLSILRTSSAADATAYLAYEQHIQAACTKNQGDAVYTKVPSGLENTASYTSSDREGDEADYSGTGQVGQFVVLISDENPDDVKVGPEMLKYAMNYILDVAGRNK